MIDAGYPDPQPLYEEGDTLVRYAPDYVGNSGYLFAYLFDLWDEATPDTGVIRGNAWTSIRRNIQVSDSSTAYRYNGSGSSKKPKSFSDLPPVKELLDDLNREWDTRLNFCLINFYPSQGYLGFHSDNEKQLVEGAPILSISLGDTRRFRLKSKNGKVVLDQKLEHGSLLSMEGDCQKGYEHSLVKMTKKEEVGVRFGMRINLTFRQMM